MKICLANSVWLVYFFPYTSPETSPPSDVEAVQDGATSIRVTWRTSCEATGYRISYTRGGGVSGGSEDLDASSTSWKLTGLVNGATYIISVVTISLHQLTSSPVTKHVTLSMMLFFPHY